MAEQTGKRAVIYARVSHPDQIENTSLKTQIESCQKYMAEHGLVLVHDPFVEKGESAADFDRTAFNELRRFVGQFDVLIVHVQDRLSRGEVLDVWNFLQEFRELGAEIHATDAGLLDVSDFLKALPVLLKAHGAYEERLKIGERTSRGKRERARSGKVVVNTVAKYGYDYDKAAGSLTTNEAEREIVEKVYQWYVLGDETGKRLGGYAIARKLTALGIPTKHDKTGYAKPKRGYGVWGRSSVMKILRDETYCGTWYYNRTSKGRTRSTRYMKPREEWIAVAVPAIVSRELWEAAQRQGKANTFHSPRNVKREYLLRARLTCSTCGYLMRCQFDHRTPDLPARYWCHGQIATNAADGKTATCHGGLDQQMVDNLVWEHIAEQLKHPERIIKAFQHKQAQKEAEQAPDRRYLERCKAELVRQKASLSRVVGLYADGQYDKEMLDKVSAPIQYKIKELEDKIAELEQRLANGDALSETTITAILRFCEQMRLGLDFMTFESKHRVIELLHIEAILHRGQVSEDAPHRRRDRDGRFARISHSMVGGSLSLSGLIPLAEIPLSFEAIPSYKPGHKSVRFSLTIRLPEVDYSQH